MSDQKQPKNPTTGAMHSFALLLGSNILPEKHLPKAIVMLSDFVEIKRSSLVWRSPSVGSPGPDFLNAAILVTTNFSQDRLKDILRHLEDTLGRVRVPDKNAPRTIDIDIVVIDGEIVDPSLWNEAFRLIPLSEILPDLYHPQTGKPIRLVAEQYIAITSITQAPLTIKQSPG